LPFFIPFGEDLKIGIAILAGNLHGIISGRSTMHMEPASSRAAKTVSATASPIEE
jgi:hypothetical protein